MINLTRSKYNPILLPDKKNPWEKNAAFNPSVAVDHGVYHMVYRAESEKKEWQNHQMSVSSIGYTESPDGIHFGEKRPLIQPDTDFDRYGCEDPRVTKIDDKFYIFYTGLSGYPFNAGTIKVACAVTADFKTIEEKHPVTPFNAKAMGLFPGKVGGKYAVVVTVNTDQPPAKICLATFSGVEDVWNREYWNEWYKTLDTHIIPLHRSRNDHIEVGAAPVKTADGWLLIYSYIYNYFSGNKIFAIEGVLLDPANPHEICGRTGPLLTPEEYYEEYGNVPNIAFPSGAIIEGKDLYVYYGAADTAGCFATCNLDALLSEIKREKSFHTDNPNLITLSRHGNKPLIEPIRSHSWESKFTFNPGALYECGKVHIFYRAMGDDDTSVVGYATSTDGFNIDERFDQPIYIPRENFEKKTHPGNSGCEDPRVTKIGDRLYICYTAYDGVNNPRVALSSIKTDDLCHKKFDLWSKPVLISPPGIDDKDACILPDKIRGKYVFLHRFNPSIWIDFVDDLSFGAERWLKGEILLAPRIHSWDSEKIGIGPPPIATRDGWLLIYHGLSRTSRKYRLGAALLELGNPTNVLARLDYPILEPHDPHDFQGFRPGTVFAGGAVVLEGQLFIYYGGADQVVGVASVPLADLLRELKNYPVR